MQQRYFQYPYKYTLQALSIEALTLPLFALYFEVCSLNNAAWTNKTSTFPAVLATRRVPKKCRAGHAFLFGAPMTNTSYAAERTALLLVDPYNDFLSEGGKLYERIKETAEQVDLFVNLRAILAKVRSAGVQVFIVPHHRYREGDYEKWQHLNPTQVAVKNSQAFAAGSWGGEWHPEFGPKTGDVIIKEHWGQSGFANTDLDEQLKQHGIQKIILVGMAANTCIESTARYGMELGYHVTLVRDATAAFSAEALHIAHNVNAPMFAHAVLTTSEVIELLPA